MSEASAVHKLSPGEVNAVLRGLATLAVIAIHVLANIPHIFQTTSPFWSDAVWLDQFSRFSVPLFVMLSGYGFWQKYQSGELKVWQFWYRQAAKLLPLYVLASLIFYVIFLFVPQWRDPEVPRSFLVQLLTGKADYQLYFVPAIFQLYLLFPLLRQAVQKLPWVTLLIAGGFQIWLYSLYSSPTPNAFIVKYLLTDQQQYIWFFTWIFYFILGMHLPKIVSWLETRKRKIAGLIMLAGLSLSIVVTRAQQDMLRGIDPIIVLRSTHVDTLFYSVFMSLLLFTVFYSLRLPPQKRRRRWLILKPLLWIGQYSYPIYLFHAMGLRMLFSI
jgi:surface polysaccharide O-acyltransferase-like enzyme